MHCENVNMLDGLKTHIRNLSKRVLTIFIVALTLTLNTKDAFADNKRLFGTIEFRSDKSKIKTWVDVLDRQNASDFFKTGKKWRGSYTKFKQKFASLKGKPKAQLELVNNYWNQYPYREDIAVYNMPDYWAIPEQFVRTSGDCEDYAIAKYYTLVDLGYSKDNMRLVIVYEPIRGFAHAILAVYLKNDIMILDNLTNMVYSHKQLKTYEPRYSINHKWRWVHMRPKQKK